MLFKNENFYVSMRIKDEKPQKTTLGDFAYFHAIQVCQMLYIGAMFRKNRIWFNINIYINIEIT